MITVMMQGRTLMELMRAFYTDPESYQLVYQFNHRPQEFDFGNLLLQLGHQPTQKAA